MARNLDRLLRPRSIAVVGGGPWCAQVVRQAALFGFSDPVWPVHPNAASIEGQRTYRSIADLPEAPDATFIGVNRHLTVEIVAALAAYGAGGAVCFASGFAEASAEDAGSGDLQAALVAAAGDMPVLGPNCYGFINALDGALLWPDQHGCAAVSRGVAILTQSSNIAINLTMQQRGLPVAYAVTCGNMAQTSQAEIAASLLDDDRITALGLHIEGFGGLRAWEALAAKAQARGVPVVALKVGASAQARVATISHTASLAGSDAGAQAFLDRLGIARVGALPDFLETLKLLHCTGPLPQGGIASISCSGGEASLIADMALQTDLHFPPLTGAQVTTLHAALGPLVSLGNPLDYNTYIWRDAGAMAAAWSAMAGPDIAMTLSLVDYPRTDATDWTCATEAAIAARETTGKPFGVVATLPELMPPEVAGELMERGVVPFFGLREALSAIEAAMNVGAPDTVPICLPGTEAPTEILTEAAAKTALVAYGLTVPQCRSVSTDSDMAEFAALTPPFAIKGMGLAHKSEAGAVRLGVAMEDAAAVARDIGTRQVLVEEMVTGGVAELLIGVLRDPAHGFVLTLGAGGVYTEIHRDTTHLLLPTRRSDIARALDRLACAPLLHGFRARAPADIGAIVDAVMAVQSYVLDNAASVSEVEVNPLICLAVGAVAVDALIRKA